MTLNTLRLLHDLLSKQSLSMSASREDVEAVLLARDELEAAIAVATKREGDGDGTAGTPANPLPTPPHSPARVQNV